jgi:hypothetical protein
MLCRLSIAAALLPLVSLATACKTVVPVPSPAQYISTKSPGLVWVTKTDNTVLRLGSPHLVGDTLTGFVPAGDYVEIPLSSVQSMRASAASPHRTALLVGGIALTGAVIAAVAIHASSTAPDLTANCNTPGAEC